MYYQGLEEKQYPTLHLQFLEIRFPCVSMGQDVVPTFLISPLQARKYWHQSCIQVHQVWWTATTCEASCYVITKEAIVEKGDMYTCT